MLQSLNIQNAALIKELEINFCDGLNIMTGETGAGKSIIIDSLGFVLGSRAAKDFIKTGEDMARVTAVISVGGAALAALEELGAEPDEDNLLLLSRTLNLDGKSQVKLNGRNITAGLLRQVGAVLVDIHSQHQHQSLLDKSRHMALLDRFCGPSLTLLKDELGDVCKAHRLIRGKISQIAESDEDRESKIDLYTFQLNEIDAAGLSEDEEDELLERRRLLQSAEKLASASHKILELLYDGTASALDKLSSAGYKMSEIADFDERLGGFAAVIEGATADLEDVVRDFRNFAANLPEDDRELDAVEERLSELNRLKRKYGRDIAAIIKLGEEIREKLELLANSDELLARLRGELAASKDKALKLCAEISDIRRENAARIAADIEGALKDLGMKNARFIIEITSGEDFDDTGFDDAEFLISANPGEPPKPLARIASGGEMSRVMLALKTALARFDHIETFIFDEIDAGVSGRTAQMVAEKLSALGKSHQIICVTHLPQIAAMGDANFLIQKTVVEGGTGTDVSELDRDGVVNEIARLIGGAEITDVTIRAAEEMIKSRQSGKDSEMPSCS